MQLNKLVEFLDKELCVEDFDDSSHNGLQVANKGKVGKVCLGVDASIEFFKAARAEGADLLICHHGISWGDSLKRITELNYERISYLMQHDMALYGCHLPLDAHPRLGNNARICRALGLRKLKPFGMYRGKEIGFEGELARATRFDALVKKVDKLMGNESRTMPFGKTSVKRIAVVSGGAAGEIEEAGRKGIDVYLSGEPALFAYHLAREYGVNAIFAGHYATEVFGVKAVAELLEKRFKIEAKFIDFGIPY